MPPKWTDLMATLALLACVVQCASLAPAARSHHTRFAGVAPPPPPAHRHQRHRRAVLRAPLLLLPIVATATTTPPAAQARQPGDEGLAVSVAQIRAAAASLKRLRARWAEYALIDAEGRAAGDTVDAARRILGGVRPQGGDAARRAADETPLYGLEVGLRGIARCRLRARDGGVGRSRRCEAGHRAREMGE